MLPLAQTSTPQLPPLPEGPALDKVRGPIEVSSGYEPWQIALALLVTLLVAGSVVWLFLRSRKKQPAPLEPRAAAVAELEAASQAADDERFTLLCSNAVRRYFESCFNLPATSQTSSEIIARLPLKADEKDAIHDFFERCDGVKFAQRALSENERIELTDTARQLIETLERKTTSPQT